MPSVQVLSILVDPCHSTLNLGLVILTNKMPINGGNVTLKEWAGCCVQLLSCCLIVMHANRSEVKVESGVGPAVLMSQLHKSTDGFLCSTT